MAIERAPAGRNNAGLWLAQQLHANQYNQADAEAVMLQYVESVGGQGKNTYTMREARSTLKAEYRRRAKEPWTSAGSGKDAGEGKRQRISRAQRILNGTPPRPVEVAPESIEGYRNQKRKLRPLGGTPAEVYLANRGIPADLAAAARCAYASNWGVVGQAVVFPIWNEAGKDIAAHGRAITAQPPDKNKRTFGPKLLGAFYTPGALDADPVAITEAPIDALTLALAGLPAIALCGISGMAEWLIKRLAKPATTTPRGYGRRVYLAFDNDAAGERAAIRIDAGLMLVTSSRLRPERKDWNEDLTAGGWDSLIEYLTAAGVFDTPAEYPPYSPDASESSYSALFGDTCGPGENLSKPMIHGPAETLAKLSIPEPAAGGEVGESLHPETCEKGHINTSPEALPASESNPRGPFVWEGEETDENPAPGPGESHVWNPKKESGHLGNTEPQSITNHNAQEETAARSVRAEALEARILAALAGRPLPIKTSSGEIHNIELYARSEAQKALHPSAFVSRPALERLKVLGVDVESL